MTPEHDDHADSPELDHWAPVGAVIPTKTVRNLISALLANCDRAEADHERREAEDKEEDERYLANWAAEV